MHMGRVAHATGDPFMESIISYPFVQNTAARVFFLDEAARFFQENVVESLPVVTIVVCSVFTPSLLAEKWKRDSSLLKWGFSQGCVGNIAQGQLLRRWKLEFCPSKKWMYRGGGLLGLESCAWMQAPCLRFFPSAQHRHVDHSTHRPPIEIKPFASHSLNLWNEVCRSQCGLCSITILVDFSVKWRAGSWMIIFQNDDLEKWRPTAEFQPPFPYKLGAFSYTCTTTRSDRLADSRLKVKICRVCDFECENFPFAARLFEFSSEFLSSFSSDRGWLCNDVPIMPKYAQNVLAGLGVFQLCSTIIFAQIGAARDRFEPFQCTLHLGSGDWR